MQKYIKIVAFVFVAIGLIFNISCINKDNIIEERTFDDEKAELDSMLNKLTEDGYNIDTTDMGVFYIIKNKGEEESPFPQPRDTCYIEYRLYLPSGRLIGKSHDYNTSGIIIFLLGETGVPNMTPGWANGIKKMKEGSEIDFFILSNLAYGKEGTANIPPFTTLIYESKMHELHPAKD